MTSATDYTMLPPPPKASKSKRQHKSARSNKPDTAHDTTHPGVIGLGQSLISYDADSSTDALNDTLNSLDTTMLSFVDNPFRDHSLFQNEEEEHDTTSTTTSAIATLPSTLPMNPSNPMVSKDDFVCSNLSAVSMLSGLHDTFSDKEREDNDAQNEKNNGSQIDVVQFLMEGQQCEPKEGGDSQSLNGSNTSSEINCDGKFVARKLAKINDQIKRYEARLNVLREKRAVLQSQAVRVANTVQNENDSTVSNPNHRRVVRRDARYVDINAIEFMRTGTAMQKYGRHCWPHFRHFELSKDGRYLIWYSAGKKLNKSRIDLRNVSKLQKGQLTPTFKKHLQPRSAVCSFSLIYSDGKSLKSLDVITKNRSSFVLWTKGLYHMMQYHRECRWRGPHQEPPPLPTELWIRVMKRNQQTIEDRLAMQPETSKKIVEREMADLSERFGKLMQIGNDPKWDTVAAMQPVKTRLVELEGDMERIRQMFQSKTMNVMSHEIWRTLVDLKTLKNKIKAISKTY